MATDNIFNLDPINTNLTAPVTDIAVQSPLDTSLESSTRSSGITNFTDSINKLAKQKQFNAIHNDTITAELAAAMGEEMQGHWEPEAQAKYTRAVDSETTRQLIQNMKDFSVVEGSDMLSDSRADHKTRATSFKNHLLGLINTGKASISRGNALEMFRKIDTNFDQIMSLANVSLAKDKKQEVLVATSKYIRTITEDTLDFAKQLAPTVSDLKPNGTRLTASEYAKKQQTFAAGWLAQHMNSRWFNSVVVEVSRIHTGATIEDIKATSLQIVGDVLLKKIANNPEIVQEKIMADIMANMSGSVKGTKVRDDIASQSEFGKKIDGINKGFRKNFKATLDALDKSRDDSDKARNENIANYVQDGMITGTITNKDQALSLTVGITNDASAQRALENHIKKHFSNENKKSIGHPDFTSLIKEGVNFYDVTTDKFDTPGFYARASEMGFTTDAIKEAVKHANPKEKRGERRKAFLDLVPIKKLDLEFESVLKSFLEEHNLLGKLSKLPKGVDLQNPIARAKFIKAVGGGKIGLQIGRVLDAQVTFGSILESIVRDNPDVPIHELVPMARNESKFLMEDVIKNNPLGTASKAAMGEKGKLTEEKIVEGHDKYNPELKETPSVTKLNAKKGLFSNVKEAQEDHMTQAVEELKAYDESKKKLIKLKEVYAKASPTKKAAIIASAGANPENLRVSSAISEIAEIVNPDPAVRRHLAVLKAKGQTKILQPMKMEKHNVWNSLANFLSSIPKTVSKAASKAASGVSKSLSEKSRELFWDKPKDETVETSEDIKDVTGAKPTEIVPTTETPPEDILGSSGKLSPTDRAKMIASNPEAQRGLNLTEKSSKKVINEKDSIVPRDVPDIVPRRSEPVPVKKPLSIPKQRLEAFNKAFPEVPNEKNKLRRLQDTAKFISDKTVIDVVSEKASELTNIIEKAFVPQAAEAVKDVLVGYVTDKEPLLSLAKYAGRIIKYQSQLALGTLSKQRKENLTKLETFLNDNIVPVFRQEITTLNISKSSLIDRMRDIYMGETNLGTNVKNSTTGAIGDMQVLPTTFAAVIVQGQFGKNAAKYSNISPERFIELKKIAKEVNELVIKKQSTKANQKAKPLAVLLSNKKVNFMAATAKMLQYLKAKKDRG